jgi:hypothetical protein
MQQSYQKLIIESQLFPPIRTIAHFIKSEFIHIEAKENYQKRSFRNRYHIGTHQGLLELSVPLLKGKNNQLPITEVIISYDTNWPQIHWRAIQSSYGKSAYFIYYSDHIREVLFSGRDSLFELNKLSIEMTKQILQQEWKIKYTEEYKKQYLPSVLDLRSKINLKNLASTSFPEYYQVYSAAAGFIPDLSILDLIFHLGPDAVGYMMKMTDHR